MLLFRRQPFILNLALQGGGAHGAFTWGVLEALVDQDGFRPGGISGTSAGALNAVLFASGWLERGALGAKSNLEYFWNNMAAIAEPLKPGGVASIAIRSVAELFSPYQANPFDFNPMRDLLDQLVDFERLRAERSLKVLIAATSVRTGDRRLFTNQELSTAAVLASSCLPWLHQAVEIDGESYWDGGYVSNPPLVALIERCSAPDVLLIRINSSQRSHVPTSVNEIRSRIGEIVFDQPLRRELAELQARRSIWLSINARDRRIARHRLHVIDGSDALAKRDPMSKIIPSRDSLADMRDLGRKAASTWIDDGRRHALASNR